MRPTIALEANDKAKCVHICGTVILNCIFYKDPPNNPVMQERFNTSAPPRMNNVNGLALHTITLTNAPPSHAYTVLRALQITSPHVHQDGFH